MNYYNEFDPHAAQWIKNLIAAGEIPNGEVDTRSITEVRAKDLKGFTQHHFFAGLAGWPLALRLAGWPEDRPIISGSPPCQSFSAAGKKKGQKDKRHLWPDMFRLIAERRPKTVFGEQVSAAIKHGWLDKVFDDLESIGYVCGASVLTASAVGANHIRSRLYWGAFLAESQEQGLRQRISEAPQSRASGGGHDTPRKKTCQEIWNTVRPRRASGGTGITPKADALRNDGAPSSQNAPHEPISIILDSKSGQNSPGAGVHAKEYSDHRVGNELRSTELGREGTGPSDASVAFQERLNVLISARIQSQIEADQDAGGRNLTAVTASARTIYVNVSTGALQLVPVPTPKKSDDQVGRMGPEATARRMARTDASRELSMDVTLAAWPKTPAACDGEGGTFDVMKAIRENLNPKAKLRDWALVAGFPTTTTRDSKSEGKDGPNRTGAPSLPAVALKASCLLGVDPGKILGLFFVPTGARVALDEKFSLWLMGYPAVWDNSAPGWKERQAWRDFLKSHYEKPRAIESSD